MRLSRACGYALHALEYLAGRAEGTPVASHHIAQARGVPEKYLLKALWPLVSAGLLRSLKGPTAATSWPGPPRGSPCWRWWRRWTARSAGRRPPRRPAGPGSTPGWGRSARRSPTACAAAWGEPASRTSSASGRR